MPRTQPPAATRIALIHALAHSIAPVNEELARQWPQCTVMNLLDDSLSGDLARDGGGLDERMHERFVTLAAYAVGPVPGPDLADTPDGRIEAGDQPDLADARSLGGEEERRDTPRQRVIQVVDQAGL